jgi:hypothetical protein
MKLKDYAIKAFNEGSDNFGERVTGEVNELNYSQKMDYYSMTVFLLEGKDYTHQSTSGIGFYLSDDKSTLEVCSGHMLGWKIPVTADIQQELNEANITEY